MVEVEEGIGGYGDGKKIKKKLFGFFKNCSPDKANVGSAPFSCGSAFLAVTITTCRKEDHVLYGPGLLAPGQLPVPVTTPQCFLTQFPSLAYFICVCFFCPWASLSSLELP